MFVLLLTTLGCQRAPYHYQPLPATPSSPAATPQLLFLSFNMTTEADGRHYLEPLVMRVVPGEANPLTEQDAPGPSYLLLTQLDAAGQPCGPAHRVPHPLVRDVEAPAENGRLQRQQVTVPQAEFFVRLARQPGAMGVRLEEVGPAAPHPISVAFPLFPR